MDLFFKDLKRELGFLMYNDNKDQIYHNFTTTLSNTINKFSTEVLYKKNNRTSNPWYDNDCKIASKTIRDAPNETVNHDEKKYVQRSYKEEKKFFINKRLERVLHLSKVEPRKF